MSGQACDRLGFCERGYYLLAAAIGGAIVLALEVLAARTMTPALGSGSVAWSALLAVALGMLAVGNLLGGVLCDRFRTLGLITWPLAVAAAWIVLLAKVQPSAMRYAAEMSLLLGNIVAAMSIQAVPLAMLGLVTPAILRAGQNTLGCWGGLVLAAGSGGGIVGALVTGLILVPGLGLTRSYLLLAVLLVLTALPAAWSAQRWAVAVLLAMLVAAAACYARKPDGVIQSQHGQIEVRESEGTKVLLIDGLPQTGMPAEVRPGEPLGHGYLLEAVLFWRRPPTDALVIGLGAGLAPRVLAAHGIACESIEIDPAVVQIARERFAFTGAVTIGDGRAILARTDRRYDMIFLDICTADRLPWHLFTREALQVMRERLGPGGILAIQFIGDDGPWSASLAETVQVAFGRGRSVMLAPAADIGPVGPRWLFAARDFFPRLPEELFSPQHPAPWRQLWSPVAGRLLTDDHFPTEWAWASTAACWRGGYAAAVRRPEEEIP